MLKRYSHGLCNKYSLLLNYLCSIKLAAFWNSAVLNTLWSIGNFQENPRILWRNPSPNSHFGLKPLCLVLEKESVPLTKELYCLWVIVCVYVLYSWVSKVTWPQYSPDSTLGNIEFTFLVSNFSKYAKLL